MLMVSIIILRELTVKGLGALISNIFLLFIILWPPITLAMEYESQPQSSKENYSPIRQYFYGAGDLLNSISKKNLVALAMLALVVTAETQSTTFDCSLALNQCFNQLAFCTNQTSAMLQQIVSNTQPVPGVDAWWGYFYTVFGAWVSVGGGILTCVCDPLTGCWFSHKTEKRVRTDLAMVQKILKGDINTLRNEHDALRKYLALIIARLDNNMGNEEALTRIDKALAAETPQEALEDLLREALQLNSPNIIEDSEDPNARPGHDNNDTEIPMENQ
jgi:hypothetical protein